MSTQAYKDAQKLLKKAPTAKDFVKIYGDFNKYWGGQAPLAQEGIRMQLEKQFEPQITQGIGNIKQDFSNRGLFRSGIRAGSENRFLGDTAAEVSDQANILLEGRKKNAGDFYSNQQGLYEKKPIGYAGLTPQTPAQYTVGAPQAQQGIGDMYGGAGTYQGGEGTSYLQAYRDYLKKKSPDYYSKYYGA